jgi:hypothetical protein
MTRRNSLVGGVFPDGVTAYQAGDSIPDQINTVWDDLGQEWTRDSVTTLWWLAEGGSDQGLYDTDLTTGYGPLTDRRLFP